MVYSSRRVGDRPRRRFLREAMLDAYPKRTGVYVLELRSGDNFRSPEFARVYERADVSLPRFERGDYDRF